MKTEWLFADSVKRRRIVTTVLLVIVAGLVSSVFTFKDNLDRSLRDNAAGRSMEMADSQGALVRAQLLGMQRQLEVDSATAGALLQSHPDELQDKLQRMVETGSFVWLQLLLPDGDSYSVGQWDEEMEQTSTAPAARAMEGNVTVVSAGNMVLVSVPVKIADAGRVQGVLTGGYPATELTQFTHDYARKYGSTLFVVRKSGPLLAGSGPYQKAVQDTGSLQGLLQAMEFEQGDSSELIASQMAVAVRNSAVVDFAGQKQLMTYTPMEVDDWYLLTLLPYSAISRDVSLISQGAYSICAKLLIAFSLVLSYLLMANRRQLEELREKQKEMRATAARYKLISARSRDVIVEYDLRKRLVMHCENGGMLSSAEMRGVNFISNIVARGVIHPEDAGLFHEQAQRAASGKDDVELDLRVKLTMSDYSWYHLSMACVFDEDGRPWRVLVRGSNIDQQKREQQLLQQKAVLDPLTHLYNKGATRNEIDKQLQEAPERYHALMIIDVDNFKHFNDDYGHLFGDKVLTCAAEQLRELFRSSDIVGRVGGDEFMVFCRDIGNPQNATRCAQQVVAIFRQAGSRLEPQVETSCSVGVAVCPCDGTDFETLYARADLALYSVKKKGKDGYVLYDAEAMQASCGSVE